MKIKLLQNILIYNGYQNLDFVSCRKRRAKSKIVESQSKLKDFTQLFL